MTLFKHLEIVQETRSTTNQKHDLIDIMFLIITAVAAGAEGWQDIETYGEAKKEWLRRFRPFTAGIPKRHTIARILNAVKPESLLAALLSWFNEIRVKEGKTVIAMDGKTLRHSYRGDCHEALHLVTAYDVENGLVLYQKSSGNKKNEIQTVHDIIHVLELKNAIVTLDALHCQKETLSHICQSQGDYVIQVKKNQKKLYEAVSQQFKTIFDAEQEQVTMESQEQGHGRKESRYVFQLRADLPDDLKEKWPSVQSIIAVERHRVTGMQGSVNTAYYLSSLPESDANLGKYIRQHWHIEDQQHWVLDVVYKEDEQRIVLEDAVENMSLFRRFVMNIFKQNGRKGSGRNKLKRAGWDDEFRAEVFFD